MENVVQRAFDRGMLPSVSRSGRPTIFPCGNEPVENTGSTSVTWTVSEFATRYMLGAGKQVKIQYKLDAEMRTGVRSASVWGTLPGATEEKTLIVAHLDGYFRRQWITRRAWR